MKQRCGGHMKAEGKQVMMQVMRVLKTAWTTKSNLGLRNVWTFCAVIAKEGAESFDIGSKKIS